MTFEEIEGLLQALTVFTLAILVGIAVISKVPATLHTPLMSGANSIHGIVLVGAMLIAAEVDDPLGYALALVAVAFATMNVVGGYVVTDRMLQMFRKKPVAPKPAADDAEAASRPRCRPSRSSSASPGSWERWPSSSVCRG
jgi:NAD(P) transhydrogenase subunit alpha